MRQLRPQDSRARRQPAGLATAHPSPTTDVLSACLAATAGLWGCGSDAVPPQRLPPIAQPPGPGNTAGSAGGVTAAGSGVVPGTGGGSMATGGTGSATGGSSGAAGGTGSAIGGIGGVPGGTGVGGAAGGASGMGSLPGGTGGLPIGTGGVPGAASGMGGGGLGGTAGGGGSPGASCDVPHTALDRKRKLLVGYWHNFDNGSTVLSLGEVSDAWDVIQVAFAENAHSTSAPGEFKFEPDPVVTTKAQFMTDVCAKRRAGKKVLISVGGQNGSIHLDTASQANFVRSMVRIILEYGFDGIDIDLESSSVLVTGKDFRSPQSPTVTSLIAAIRELRDQVVAARGGDFMLTMAPETAQVYFGYTAYTSAFGSYIPLLHALRDMLTFVHAQHYNTGGTLALDGNNYGPMTAGFHAAMAELLLAGFNVPGVGAQGPRFEPLRPDQVVIGLPAVPPAAPAGGFTPAADVHAALHCLAGRGCSGTGYTLQNAAGYPGFRGLMSWSINWDAANGSSFSRPHRAFLDGSRPRHASTSTRIATDE